MATGPPIPDVGVPNRSRLQATTLGWSGSHGQDLLRFFRFLGKERTAQLQFIFSDMWQAYLKVIAKKASGAIHVLDRFHVMQKMSTIPLS